MIRKVILIATIALAMSGTNAQAGKVYSKELAHGLDIVYEIPKDGKWNCKVEHYSDGSVFIECD